MHTIGIIPARYYSTRLEGKPLLDIAGKPMIQRVYEQARKSLKDVFIATDDPRIYDTAQGFGAKVVMTSNKPENGTQRVKEAYDKIEIVADVIINIQGDEPLLEPLQLEELQGCFHRSSAKVEFATLVAEVCHLSDLQNSSEVFVTIDKHWRALYFSRSVIPAIHGVKLGQWLEHHSFYKHVGIYAYTPTALSNFCAMHPTGLEKVEGLEQNRWLENGKNIYTAKTIHETYPVDTQEDLDKVVDIIKNSSTEQ